MLGFALDLTTSDTDESSWDFDSKVMRDRALRKLKEEKPLLRVGSPMCTDWSATMNLNWHKYTEEEKTKRMREARDHLAFCIKLYKMQHANGRYFLHEHPLGAKSWKEENMQDVANLPGVIR